MPTNAQNVSRYTEKNSGGPNCSANFATIGDRKVIIITATSAPTNDEVNAAVSASPARPFCASGIAVERGRDRPGLAREC